MAHYHCSIKILKRSDGRNSIQFSSYMSNKKMRDKNINRTFSAKSKDEVVFNEMLYADRVDQKIRTQSKFWNSVEAVEKQYNAQVARTFEIALPHELTLEQNLEVAKAYAQSLIDDGLPAVQYAMHMKQGNWHMHLMIPMRDYQNGRWCDKEKSEYMKDEEGNKIPELDENGKQKTRTRKGKGTEKIWKRIKVNRNKWNDKSYAKIWRERAATLQNEALERYGFNVRVDHRSYKDRGINKIPQKHEGYNARKIEREGGISEICEYNREVTKLNAELESINEEIKSLNNKKDALIHEKNNANKHIYYSIYNFLNNELNSIRQDNTDVDMSDYKEEAYRLAGQSLKFKESNEYAEAKKNYERVDREYKENHKFYNDALSYIKKHPTRPKKGLFNGSKIKEWDKNNDIVKREKELIYEYYSANSRIEKAKEFNDEKYLKALTSEANKYIKIEKGKRIGAAMDALKKPINAGIGFLKKLGNINYDNTDLTQHEQDLAVVSLWKMVTGKVESQNNNDLKEFFSILSSAIPTPGLMDKFRSALGAVYEDIQKRQEKKEAATNPAFRPKDAQEPRHR